MKGSKEEIRFDLGMILVTNRYHSTSRVPDWDTPRLAAKNGDFTYQSSVAPILFTEYCSLFLSCLPAVADSMTSI